jgi:hypothetical protein
MPTSLTSSGRELLHSSTTETSCVPVRAARMQLHRAPTDNDRTGYLDMWVACGLDKEMIVKPDASLSDQTTDPLNTDASAVRHSSGASHVTATVVPGPSDQSPPTLLCTWTMVPCHAVDSMKIYTLQQFRSFLEGPLHEVYMCCGSAEEEGWIRQLGMEFRLGRSSCRVRVASAAISTTVGSETQNGAVLSAMRVWKAWLYINSTIPCAEELIGGGFGHTGAVYEKDREVVSIDAALLIPAYTQRKCGGMVVVPTAPVEVHYTAAYTLTGEEALTMRVTVDAAEVPIPLPRLGLQVNLPRALDSLRWWGAGPHECYSDRRSSAVDALHAADLGSQTLHVPYVRPGENGSRTDTKWVQFTEKSAAAPNDPVEEHGLRISCSRRFNFSAQPHTTEDLARAMHTTDLTAHPRGYLAVNVDPFLMGVGGDDSWSACVHPEYELRRHLSAVSPVPNARSFIAPSESKSVSPLSASGPDAAAATAMSAGTDPDEAARSKYRFELTFHIL